MWKRLLIAAILTTGFISAWITLDRIRIDVVGQPTATGVIQRDLEKPFFENLAATTGLRLDIRYRPNDTLGIKDNHQLTMLKEGKLDLVSLRFLQNASSEPTLLGIDPLGLATDFKTARAVVDAYAPVLDERLQQHFNAKLLGVWPFGPQVFFCRVPVRSLSDIRNLRVRVGNENFAPLIASFGAKPVVIAFEEVKAALQSGMIDCAISSATSAYFAGWGTHTTHLFSLATHMGINGYAINLRLWNRLSQSQQTRLEQAFRQHIEAIWQSAERIQEEAIACNTGGPCLDGIANQLIETKPSALDYQLLHQSFDRTTFKDWAERCDRLYPGCSQDWSRRVAPILATAGANP